VTISYTKNADIPVPYKPGKDGVNDAINRYVTRTIIVKEPGKDGVNDAINRYVTRTIIVKEPGKEPQTITQTVHFTNEDK
ncbi:hypothetical protein G5S89_08080, partial [Lactobacillus jensenii]|uniref:hypothetical protein n=1 Tax=Lactobacillus jensenii TaxID=109790 RepID=UPI0013D746EA